MKKLFVLVIAIIIVSAMVYSESNDIEVVIYKNEACGHCEIYLNEFKDFLYDHGYNNITEKLMINDSAVRKEVAHLSIERNIPLEMQEQHEAMHSTYGNEFYCDTEGCTSGNMMGGQNMMFGMGYGMFGGFGFIVPILLVILLIILIIYFSLKIIKEIKKK